MNNSLFPSTDPEGTIKVPYAKTLSLNWRTYLKTSKQAFATHAFVIPIVSFQNILKYNPNAEAVRAYIGLEDPANPASVKLMLVPIIGGNDVLYLSNAANAITEGEGDDDDPSNVYDLTKPCPPECGSGGLDGE